jgi:hypothetical protein
MNETEEKKELSSNEILPSGLAKVFYESKIFKDIQSEAQAIVKILAGRELGLSPIQSMNSVYIVGNKIGYETKVFLSKIKKSGKYDYAAKYGDDNVEVEFFRVNGNERESLGKSEFSLKEAARVGLINKEAYKRYPKLMMFYRAASNGIKMYCPDILDGAALAEDYIEEEEKEKDVQISLIGDKIKVKSISTIEEDITEGEENKYEED